MPLHSARLAVTYPAEGRQCPLSGTKLYCLVTEACRCKWLAQDHSAQQRLEPVTSESQVHCPTSSMTWSCYDAVIMWCNCFWVFKLLSVTFSDGLCVLLWFEVMCQLLDNECHTSWLLITAWPIMCCILPIISSLHVRSGQTYWRMWCVNIHVLINLVLLSAASCRVTVDNVLRCVYLCVCVCANFISKTIWLIFTKFVVHCLSRWQMSDKIGQLSRRN